MTPRENISGPEFQSSIGVYRAGSSDWYGFGALAVLSAVAAIVTVFSSVVVGAVLGAAALAAGVKALKSAHEEVKVTSVGIEMRTWRYRLSVGWDEIVAFDPAAATPSLFPSVGRRFAEWFNRSRGMPLAEVVETSHGDRFRLSRHLVHEQTKVPVVSAVGEFVMRRLLEQAHQRLHAGEQLSFGRLLLDRVGLALDGVRLGPEVEVDLLGGWLLVWDSRRLLYRERWHRVRSPHVLVAFVADRRLDS